MTIPAIQNKEIYEVAERFLAQYHPVGTPPVPIERIIEFGVKLTIIPLPGLRSDFSLDGFISQDLQHIYVDNDLMSVRCYLNRLRFTLAEEVSHRLLHSDWFQTQRADSLEEWKEYVRWLKRHDGPLERQARRCAAAILVPRRQLTPIWDRARYEAKQQGIDLDEWDEYGVLHLVERVAAEFQVSPMVLKICLERDGLIEKTR